MPRVGLICVLCAGLGACSVGPDLPPADRQLQGAAPALVPISGILDQAGAPLGAPASLSGPPQARAAALRARAAALRGPVIAASDRARLLGSGARLR